MTEFSAKFIPKIALVEPQQWQALLNDNYPFYQYSFLHALEHSGCVSAKTGWQPLHLLIYVDKQLVAAMPCYLKMHSYGEYMFDWNWAQAFESHGINYYPKLVSSIPFTPAQGKRILIHPRFVEHSETIHRVILTAVNVALDKHNGSNFQWLFIDKTTSDSLQQLAQGDDHEPLLQRSEVQYHWFNRDYQNFDEFLATMTSRKRKNISKERIKVTTQGLHFNWLSGAEITIKDWQLFYQFYQQTYLKRSGHQGYLNADFFTRLSQTMTDKVLLLQVHLDNEEVVASALFFKSDSHLYGRYWGCSKEYDFLHFETCYYQGIEYCIEHKLSCFDAGAQGEHKLSRGFEPVTCYGNYLIKQPQFHQAISDFIAEEKRYHRQYIESAKQYLPYKNNR
ncbi:hypothetical protein A9Q98_09675 [Thalassotalea sp. 42_200_T64]|nr:hypothetical protein A9Q98_09675 [Thalassotalea sp. 42_200_T64]